jgi:TRAP-type C4-dicarboxylate transport system permease small subunit
MSYVYAGVSLGCIGMFVRQAQNVWRNYKMQWRRPHDMHDQIIAD